MNFIKLVILLSIITIISPLSQAKKIRNGGFKYYIESTPSWVKKNSYPNANQETQHIVDIDYLLADQQVLAKGKRLVNFYRYAQKALNISSLERASTIEIDFDPSYQRLIFHSVNIIRNGKKINALRSKDIKLIRQEKQLTQGMLNGRVTALMIIPASQVGDVIDYSFSVVGQNPVFGYKHFITVSPEYGVPLGKSYFRFISSAKKKYYTRLTGLDKTELKIRKKGRNREYIFEKEMSPAHLIEDNIPSWFHPYPMIEISEFKNWGQVSSWASKMYRPKKIRNREVNKLIKQLKPLTQEQQIISALHFVQNEIRYLGLELATNSHKPHHPDTVVKNRYGDCKDKTVLLTSILKKLGIKAYPALVNTRAQQEITQWQPSPGAFNHVITMIELDGQQIWLDPTRTYQEGNLETMGYKSYSHALLLNHRQKDLVAMPQQKPADNHQKFRSQYIIRSYQKPVELTVTQKFFGNYADWKRAQFSKSSLYNIEQHFLNAIQNYHPNAVKVNKLRVLDDKENNIFSVVTHYRLEQFFDIKDEIYYYNLDAFSIREQLEEPIEKNRTQPYALAGPALYEHQVAIDFPDFDLMSYPQAIDKLSTEQIDYTLTRDNVDLSQQFNHQLRVKSDFIPSQKSLEYTEMVKKIKVNSFETWHLSGEALEQANEEDNAFLSLLDKLEKNHVIQN